MKKQSQTSFAGWRETKHKRSLLTRPGHASRLVPFLASGLCELSPGGDGPFDSNRLCFEQPEPNELFAVSLFERKHVESRMLMYPGWCSSVD